MKSTHSISLPEYLSEGLSNLVMKNKKLSTIKSILTTKRMKSKSKNKRKIKSKSKKNTY